MVEERKSGRKEFTASWLIWLLYVFMIGLMAAMVAATVVVYQNARRLMEAASQAAATGGLPQPYAHYVPTGYCFFLLISASLSLACLMEATHLKNLREQSRHYHAPRVVKTRTGRREKIS